MILSVKIFLSHISPWKLDRCGQNLAYGQGVSGKFDHVQFSAELLMCFQVTTLEKLFFLSSSS